MLLLFPGLLNNMKGSFSFSILHDIMYAAIKYMFKMLLLILQSFKPTQS